MLHRAVATMVALCLLVSGCARTAQLVPVPNGNVAEHPAGLCGGPLNGDTLFVADPGSAPAFYNATLEFPVTGLVGTVNLAPSTQVQGSLTQLSQDYGIAVDDDCDFYISNHNTNAITAYTLQANGNVAPLRVVAGSSTGLNAPWDLDLDYTAEILYALNAGTPSVTVYAEPANGNVAPLRTIAGAATQLGDGEGIAVDNFSTMYRGYVYVTNKSAGKLLMFAPNANGNVAPFHVLAGSATGLFNPQGVAVDKQGYVYVTNTGGSYNNAVLVYAPGPNGNQAPVRIIRGSLTGLNSPLGITTWDAQGEMFVSNPAANSITSYHLTSNGNVSPIATIVGTKTNLRAPAFIQYHHVP